MNGASVNVVADPLALASVAPSHPAAQAFLNNNGFFKLFGFMER